MNALAKTLVYGMAALGALLVGLLGMLLFTLNGDGALDVKAMRALVITPQEREWIAAMRKRADEPAAAKHYDEVQVGMNRDELIDRIAESANTNQAGLLVEKLKSQQQALDERQAWIDQQWSDLQLAKGSLERMQRQLAEQQKTLAEAQQKQDQERARWAAAQADEAQRVQVMGDVEKARYRDQAKLFEQMKDNAWDSLRRFPPRDIARYLALMDPKKAARMLVLAQQDPDNPNLATAIHREMLMLDLDRATGDQTDRLANLYSFMPATQILPYLKDSSPADIAALMKAMAAKGLVKKRAELMDALRQEDGKREMDVRRLLEQP
jgi:flagellar motility protein MotE (MotC chaperone)